MNSVASHGNQGTLTNAALLDALRAAVEQARGALDNGQGVKLLYSDISSLSNDVWTVGLNPGGTHAEPDQWCREDGAHDYRDGYLNAWVTARRPRGVKLREQLGMLMQWLGVDWSETLSLNLIPFRSRSWHAMPSEWREEALRFARESFWPLLLAHRQPRLILSFDKRTAQILRELLGHGPAISFPVGWAGITSDISAGEDSTLLRLPHLSRFLIFGRKEGKGAEELATLREAPALVAALSRKAG